MNKNIFGKNALIKKLNSFLKEEKYDYYMYSNVCSDRLREEYIKHGSLIIAVDFDGTINDFHNMGIRLDTVIDTLKMLKPIFNFKYVIYTAEIDEEKVRNKCNEIGLEIDGVNIQLLEQFKNSKKLYYNLLLDDRAGLYSAYCALVDFATQMLGGE